MTLYAKFWQCYNNAVGVIDKLICRNENAGVIAEAVGFINKAVGLTTEVVGLITEAVELLNEIVGHMEEKGCTSSYSVAIVPRCMRNAQCGR